MTYISSFITNYEISSFVLKEGSNDMIYYQGDTIKINFIFTDYDNQTLIDPSSITMNFYNDNYGVYELINSDSSNYNKIDIGSYYYMYILPFNYNYIIYEISAIMPDGSTSISRQRLSLQFV